MFTVYRIKFRSYDTVKWQYRDFRDRRAAILWLNHVILDCHQEAVLVTKKVSTDA